MSTLSVTVRGTTLTYDPETLRFSVEREGARWAASASGHVELDDGKGGLTRRCFADARHETRPWKTGLGEGFITRVEGIPGTSLAVETLLWVDNCRGELFAELIPREDPKDEWKHIVFPAAFDFAERRSDWYAVLPIAQGALALNDDPSPMEPPYAGQYYTWGAFMPWFGQVKGRDAYIAVSLTPWDGGYRLAESGEGPRTVAPRWLPSLGRVATRRVTRYTFVQGDYNDLAGVYRQYAHETGLLVTLREKAVRNPLYDKLVGCAIVHEGIFENISPDSRYYDHEHPQGNTRLLATFDERAAQLRALKEKWGVEKVYFHMDGWGVDGYDSHHPDNQPPCAAAGGWEGMARLSDACKALGYMLATHDQYRDYHYNAETFSEDMAVHDTKGKIETHSIWYGGRQSFLCATQAPGYVRRNYTALKDHGVDLEGTYQDVFTSVPLDECDFPWHPMTRKECMEYRKACFDWVSAQGIAVSSEDAIDWGMASMGFVHHAPYRTRDGRHVGVPVPLTNLVYHDCLLQPMNLGTGPSYTGGLAEGESGLLLALLEGCAGYLPIEPTAEDVEKYRVVSALQRRIQHEPMVRHEILSPGVERAIFGGGVTVTVDFNKGTYDITPAS